MYPLFKISRIHLFNRILLKDRLTELSAKIDSPPRCFVFHVPAENMNSFITLLEEHAINAYTFFPAGHPISKI
ncbi:hypothetical protein [Ohtaekwangia sp.]|uniref:hypothetical protein n=1 Tax=Ohtaekwangia sp. TaxID=2066019 RepID=UPI002F943C12